MSRNIEYLQSWWPTVCRLSLPMGVKILCICSAMLCMLACSCGRNIPVGIDPQLLDSLSRAVEHHDEVMASREKRIVALRNHFYRIAADSADARRAIASQLYSEYYSYNFDSAAYWAERKLDAARFLSDSSGILDAQLQKARALLQTGRPSDATAIISSLDESDKLKYLPEIIDLKANVEERYGSDGVTAYLKLENALPDTSAGHLLARSNRLRLEGNYTAARELLVLNIDRLENNRRDTCYLRYMIARLQLLESDTIGAVNNLLRSATADLSLGVRDYRSVCLLAHIFFLWVWLMRLTNVLTLPPRTYARQKHRTIRLLSLK